MGFKDYLIFIPASLSESKSPTSHLIAPPSMFNVVTYMFLYIICLYMCVYSIHTHGQAHIYKNIINRAQFYQCHDLSCLGILNLYDRDSNVSRD